MVFHSINAGGAGSGPVEGVVLLNSAAGPLTVSGGTIQSTTGTAAVSLSSTGPVSLTGMTLQNNTGDGIYANIVPTLSVFSSTFTGGAAGIVAGGDASTSQQAQIFDIETDHFGGQQGAALSLLYAGTTDGVIQNDVIGSESPVTAGSVTGDGIDVWPTSNGTMLAEVTGTHIVQIDTGIGIHAAAPGTGTLDLTLSANTVQMDSASSHNGVTVGSPARSA